MSATRAGARRAFDGAVTGKLSRGAMAFLTVCSLVATASVPTRAHSAAHVLPTLRVNWGFPADGFDPQGTGSPYQALVYAGLVRRLPSGRVAPDLATWKVSRNRRVYTFTLRKGARFSNGHPVTAQDVLFSFERGLAPRSSRDLPARATLGLIKGVGAYVSGTSRRISGIRILNARTLRITITRPATYFLAQISYSPDYVLDPAVVRSKPIDFPRYTNPPSEWSDTCTAIQGAGPFRFVCHGRGKTLHSFYAGSKPSYTLAPNPYYWGRKPRITVKGPDIPDGDDYRLYVHAGLDVSGVPPPQVDRWRGKSAQYHPFPTSTIDYLVPNVHVAPFNNVHCRLALAYAINRPVLADNVLHGEYRATYAIVPKGIRGYYAGADNPHYSRSEARAELARCPGRAVPFELTYFEGGDEPLRDTAIGSMLSAVGMNVKLNPVSGGDWARIGNQDLSRTGTQLFEAAWSPDYADPRDFCTVLLALSPDQHGGNIGEWHDRAYDRLVAQADATGNQARRVPLYVRAQHIALTQGAIVMEDYRLNPTLIKPYVHGLIGSAAWDPTSNLVPKQDDWSNVSISKH